MSGNLTVYEQTQLNTLDVSGNVSFMSTNAPTSSAVLSSTDNSTNIPTTGWVNEFINNMITTVYYNISGTYTQTVPSGTSKVTIVLIGGGGGGGSGCGFSYINNNNKGATGGAGGGGGGITIVTYPIISETSFTVTVGRGGPGGLADVPGNFGLMGLDGTHSFVQYNDLYYGYAEGGKGGEGGINNVLGTDSTQPSGGNGGYGTQGTGGNGGNGVGLGGPPTGENSGFTTTSTIGFQSTLIGAGGGGGGGAVYLNGTGDGATYDDSDGGNGGSLGQTLSGPTILQGGGPGGIVDGTPPTQGNGILGVGGGGGGGGHGSRSSGISPGSGANGIYGSGGGGGGSSHVNGAPGGNGGDGVVIFYFT